MHTALFRKRVFADITKDLKIVLDYRDGPQTLVREAERGLRRGGQEVVWGLRQRRGPWPLAQQAPQTLEPPDAGRGRKHPPLQPREGQRPFRHLAFGLLASRAERHAISVVGSLQPSVGAAPSPRTLRGAPSRTMPPAPSGPTPPVAADTGARVISGDLQWNRASQTTGLWGPHRPEPPESFLRALPCPRAL